MRYVIIGGGPAATNAMETIRQFDSDGSIALVSDEPAHSRMALPYWLNGKISREQTLTADDDSLARLRVESHVGRRAAQLDLDQRRVVLDGGDALEFDKLFLATGSSPVTPPIEGIDHPDVQTMWTLSDVEKCLERFSDLACPRIAFIGAGFVGMILVGALAHRQCKLTVIEQADQILPRMLDAASASQAENWLATRDVDVVTGAQVVRISVCEGNDKHLELADGSKITADLVVLATGVRPNLRLVEGTAIRTDQGIVVDDHLRTSVDSVYAGGDVAQGPSLYGDTPAVHAIQPTAVDHGRVAGANMAGADVAYPGSLLMNVVDVCGLQCVSYGNWQSGDDEVVIDNSRDFIYRRLVFRGDHLVGALFVGRPHEVGMLNDIGMVKGILQTRPALGSWKEYLKQNPFDVRRPYIALKVPERLVSTTLLGRPSQPRQYRHGNAEPQSTNTPAHRWLLDAVRPS